VAVDKASVLKIDKDCLLDRDWMQDYLWLILATCQRYGVNVVWIRTCSSKRKGQHFYIKVTPPVKAELANKLQFLLGDDCQRVDFNRARIESGLNEWSKLFEEPGTRLRTIYRLHGVRSNENDCKNHHQSYCKHRPQHRVCLRQRLTSSGFK